MFNVEGKVETFKNLSAIAAIQKQQLPSAIMCLPELVSQALEIFAVLVRYLRVASSIILPPRAIPTSDEPKYRVKARNDAR